MKITCLQENLSHALNIAARFVSTKTQLPVLGNFLLTTEKGRLKIAATNLEISICLWIGAKVEKEGGVSLPARTFLEFISSLPAEKVILASEEGLLKVEGGSFRASFNGSSPQDFPSFPQGEEKSLLTLPKDLFSKTVLRVSFSASQDEGRPILTGVKWLFGSEEMQTVATDGYRLSLQTLVKTEGKVPIKEEFLIIPARALLEVAKIARETQEEEIKIFSTKEKGQLVFALKEMEIAARLLEGEFPEFQKIIPQGFSSKVHLEKESFLRAVKTASLFARDSANIVRLKLVSSEGKVVVSANSPQVGENVCEIEAKIEGEEVEAAFNCRYLLDLLNNIEGEEIVFETSGPLNPGVFKILGDDSYLHIIMPVRVQV